MKTFKRYLEEEPRIPRKKGQPAGSDKHSDLYTDENPKGTIHGLKFATVEDAENPVDTLKGINRVDGRTEHKIDDDLEIIVSEPDEEGLFEIRKCA